MGGMSKAFTDPFCLAPLRQRETRLDGSEGVGLLSAHSTPKKRWCKRCNTPMGNLIQTLLPAVILLLQGKIAKQVSPYPSILTLIIAGNRKLHTCCSVLQMNIVCVISEFWSYPLIKIYISQKSNPILRWTGCTSQVWLIHFYIKTSSISLSFGIWLKSIPDSYPNHRYKCKHSNHWVQYYCTEGYYTMFCVWRNYFWPCT